MESKEFALFVAECLAEKQADEIVVLEVTEVVGYTDFMVLGSARSGRQMQAIVSHIERRVNDTQARKPYGREGVQEGNWGLLDYGDVVVHLFRGEERLFYDLEGLWSEAPRVAFDADAVVQAAAP